MMTSIIGSESLLPVGYRFYPTDEEIVNHFLKLKMLGMDSQVETVAVVDVCKYEPWDLPGLSRVKSKDQEWYFFCPRVFKYASGRRQNRTTETGHWKPTGKDREIKIPGSNKPMATKKTLVFHKGRGPSAVGTNWVMHEYHPTHIPHNKGSFVFCRLKKNPDEKNQDSDFGNSVAEDTIPEVNTQLETNLEFTIEPTFQSLDYMFASALQRQPQVQEENESSYLLNCLNGVPFQIGTDQHDEDVQFVDSLFLDYDETSSQMNFAVETEPNDIDMFSDTLMRSRRRDHIEDNVFGSDSDIELPQEWYGHLQEAPNLLKQHASSNQYQQMRMVRTPIGKPISSIHEQYREGKKVLRDEINCLELVSQEFPVKVTTCKPKYEQRSNNEAIWGVAPSSIESHERLSGIGPQTKDKGGEAAKHGTVVAVSPKTPPLRRQSNPPSVYFVNAIVGVVLFIVVLRELVLFGQWC